MARGKKNKPMNRERRIKEILNKKPEEERKQMPPPTIRHQDKRDKRNKRNNQKSKLKKEYIGMELAKIARLIINS